MEKEYNNAVESDLLEGFYSATEFRQVAKNDLNKIFQKYGRI